MPGNDSLVTAIVDRLRPYVEDAASPGGLELIESQLRLLDAVGGDQVGTHLSEMLGAVDRAVVGIEQGNPDAAIAEGDRWGVGHLVRAALESGRVPGSDGASGQNPGMGATGGRIAQPVDNPRAGAVDPPSFPSSAPDVAHPQAARSAANPNAPHPPDPAHMPAAPAMSAPFGTDTRTPRFDQFTGEPIDGQRSRMATAGGPNPDDDPTADPLANDKPADPPAEDRHDAPPEWT